MLALPVRAGFYKLHMLQQAQERIIQRTAHDLTLAELPLEVETDRYVRMRIELLFVSRFIIMHAA